MPGSYTRVCALATGGMAAVELVVKREGAFERIYALKRLLPHFRADDQVRAMFLDEARFAGLIRHANVAGVLDLGEDAEGPFLVMDYVEGVTLAELLQHQRKLQELLPIRICLRIGAQIADGLHAAHELCDASGRPLELVHRDVSPQNVMVGFDGVVRVMDFGIAKALGQSTRTGTGVLKGKFGYMSPEQLRFEEPDRRSDLFSLGVVLYELLTGLRLYANREGNEGARRILTEPAPDVTDERAEVPAAVVELLFELLAKKRELRPATAREVSRRLEAACADLDDGGEPGELSDYLEQRFGERRRSRSRELTGLLAKAETEVANSAATSVASPARRPRWGAVAAGAGALALAVATIFVWRSGDASGGANHQPVPEHSPPAEGFNVAIEIQTLPPGATLFVDGQPRGVTPASVQLPRSERSIRVRLEKDGYRDVSESIVLNVDQRLRYALVASAAPKPPPKPVLRSREQAAKPATSSKPARDFKRFD